MIRLQRTIYVCGVLLWMLYGLLFPTWVSSFNVWLPPEQGGWQSSRGHYERAPIWRPPMPASDALHPSVRWPWQPISQRDHFELAIAAILARCSAGIIVLGFVFRGLNWIRHSEEPDALLSIAWSLSLSLVIAWLCIIALAAFSMGYAATDPVVIDVLLCGTMAGLIYGLGTHWRRRSRLKAARLGTDLPPNRTAAANPNDEACRPVRQIGTGLLSFTLGIVAGFCITWAAMFIAASFRGPVLGVWELGTPRYAHDQTLVNLAGGLGILTTGWILGILLLSRRQSRGFALGLLVATTALGITFAMWK